MKRGLGAAGSGALRHFEGVCRGRSLDTGGGCDVDGYATDFSWGYRLLAIATLPVPKYGVEFSPILRWFHDVEGYAVDGSQHQDRQALRLQFNTVFQRRFFLNISRTWLKSDTEYDAARDKDAWILVAGLVF
jgi:hypothetical protein